MQAIILAAGMGKRLKELTRNNTKCMVEVNGITLIDRLLHQLEQKHLSRIVIVVGYEGKKLIDYIETLDIHTPIVFIDNPIYDKTNNIYSLSLAKKHLCQEDTLLFESDLIFDDGVIDELLEDSRDTLALVDKFQSWMDGTCLEIAEDGTIEAFISGKKLNFEERDRYYKTVNIYKFSREFSKTWYVPFLEAYTVAMGNNEYYEQVLNVITKLDHPMIKAKPLHGQKWYEIDDAQDLDIATTMFASDGNQRLALIQSRYGGYWRYPGLLDFCYLVNPYYPPQKLIEEMKASFETLLTAYPSGMRVNSLLAAKNFGVHQENVVIGNGAAELIKAVMEHMTGKIGFVRPTFEEYPNRYVQEHAVSYYPETEGFRYSAQNLIDFFEEQDIAGLVVVNPDNPSGNYIPKQELLQLIAWTGEKKIQLLVDESFVDFSDEEDSSLLEQRLLEENPHLLVMKSISKSYGVPGLRLGILASGNQTLIAALKKDVAIWNINSFAEFYMQIAEKYQKEYQKGLQLLRAERARFEAELQKLEALEVFPSQANYILVRLHQGIQAKELTRELFCKDQILVKDLTAKSNGEQYLRIAIRNTKDNDCLLAALREKLEQLKR